MAGLDSNQRAEFLHRSYTAVDGLWFMQVEEKYRFEAALEIDREVWSVMPKIQARMMKSMLRADNGMESLLECFSTKLTLDGFTFRTEKPGSGDSFRIIIEKCPWHSLMVKSGRESISARVGTVICNTEYSGWAAEFGDDIGFELQQQICKSDGCCLLQFTRHPAAGQT